MNRNTLFSAGFLFCLTNCVLSFSVLSVRYPFGMPIQVNNGASLAMAGSGVGIYQPFNILLLNPANLGKVDKTVFSTLIIGDYVKIEENSSQSSHFSAQPSQISFGFPLGQIGAVGFSFEKASDATIKYQGELNYDSYPFPIKQGISLTRKGGLKNWNIGWGISPLKHLSLGTKYIHSYYSIHNVPIIGALIDSSQLILGHDSSYTRCTFHGLGVGILTSIGNLTLGLQGNYFFKSNATTKRALYEKTLIAKKPNSSQTLQPPPSLKTGIAYKISQDWLLASDAGIILWSLSSNDSLASVVADKTIDFSIGAQYVPVLQLIKYRYWETLQYRAGLCYRQLPISNNVKYAVTGGIGLPLDKGNGILDLVIELGIRKDNEISHYSEKYVHFGLGINGGRKWKKNIEDTY